MAATVGSSICVISRSSQKNQIKGGPSGIKSVSFLNEKTRFPSFTLTLESKRLRLSCAAKQETVDKVCEIVRKQLAVPDGTVITGESNFVALGADSLDTVEIVMELEEEFGISMENESAEKIETVLDAADLIEKLMVESG